MCSVICAPVKLDRQRKTEIEQIESRRVSEVSERDSVISKHRDTIAEKDAALSRKHPADEHKERLVRVALADFSLEAKRFMVWLLAHGEVPYHNLRSSDVQLEEINEALKKGRMRQLIVDRYDKGVVISRINGEVLNTLRNELHPPNWPGEPPQV